MSQRRRGILTSNSEKGPSQEINQVFSRILKDSGVRLATGDDPNGLTQEQALVARDIQRNLEEDVTVESIKGFIAGLKTLCKKEKYLRKALMPTQLSKSIGENDGTQTITVQQDSLFRIFLRVTHLQTEVIELILDEITSNATEDNQDASPLRILLNQLRYLPHIRDPANLTNKLLDIMEISSFPSQLEILDSLPEILPDSEYHETAKQLSKLLDKNDELSGAIIDCLNALNLESDVRVQVQDHILSKILTGTSTKIFPVLLEFLMTDYKAQNLVAMFLKIRNALDPIMASPTGSDKEKESGKIVIFNRLQALSTAPKVLPEAWITMITNVKVHTDHKPVDLLLLLMLHSSAKVKKRVIEVVLRKRVKDGMLRCSLLEQFFNKYLPQQLLRDYFASMIEIGCSLLRSSNEVTVVEFASTLFKLLFNHDQTEVIYRQELIDSLLLLTGEGGGKSVTPVLKIFTSLLDDITKIQHHTVLLMRLLEKLDSFELKDVKLVFEILCRLTCSDESLSGLKEEIHMIIRKQLSSSKRTVKHRGIISAVVMAKHVATSSLDQSDIVIDEDEVVDLKRLKGGAREGALLLELASTSTSGYPELVVLYFDQLAAMLVTADNLDKYFEAWLFETISNEFMQAFVTEKVCDKINDITFSMQYNLNSAEEVQVPIGVNIAETMLKSGAKSITVLPPHFRLLRLLHFKLQNGDLTLINALLGCSVILPKVDLIDDLDQEQLKLVADCLFHCINWFREVVSAFVTQKSRTLKVKVLQRVDNLIELEKMLEECLASAPGHKLPPSYFDPFTTNSSKPSTSTGSPTKSPQKKKRPPAKKQKTSADTSADATTSTPGPSTSKATPAKPPKKSCNVTEQDHTVVFREIDTDFMKLLRYNLDEGDNEMPVTSQLITLNLHQLQFILKDFVVKLTQLTTGANLGLSHLTTVAPESIVTDCVKILPSVNLHLKVVTKRIDGLLETTEGRPDALEMFSEEALQVKSCFGLILDALALIFKWSGFQHSKRLDLLRDVLKALRPSENSQALNSVNRLVAELVTRLGTLIDRCLHLSHAVSLIDIMEALFGATPTPEIRGKIASVAGKLLHKRWYNHKGDPDCVGKLAMANIDALVKAYLSSANVKTICGLVGTLQEQAPSLQSKEDCLEMLVTIDKRAFPIFYRNLLATLHERIKTEIQSLTNNEHLRLWHTAALTMQGLMTVVKAQETKPNLVCFLKKSIAILKIFLSQGIPILEIMLRSKPDQVVEVFKAMQTNTRFLHHLCCFSKLTKDTSLTAYVPQFRLTLESLVYRVKAALVANNCSEAFWMGNLRNKDLQGEDILSQSTGSTVTEPTVAEEDETDLPEDDDSEEDLFGNAEEADGSSRCASEAY